MGRYIKARKEFNWKRNAQWPGIPQDPGTEDKVYLVYAVIEDNPNQLGLFTNTGTVVDWGDGTSGTQSGGTFDYIYHEYDYSTVTGTILTLEDGRNYKTVLVEADLVPVAPSPEYLLYLSYNNSQFQTDNTRAANNVLEVVSYLGDGVTTSGVGSSRVLLGVHSNPTLMEHASIKTPNDLSLLRLFYFCKNLKKIDLPAGFFNSASLMDSTFWAASLYGAELGDIEVESVNSTFRYIDFVRIGNISSNDNNISNLFLHSNNYTVGNATFTSCVSAIRTFGGTVNNGAGKIGLLNFPLLGDCRYMFQLSQMPEVEFISSCSSMSNTLDMFDQCTNVQKLIMPGLTVGIDIIESNLSAVAINDFFTSVGTASGAQTLNVSENPGSATCDPSIATAKGWTVIT